MTNDDFKRFRTLLQEELAPVNNRLDKIEKRLDGLENRFDSLEKRLDSLEERVDRMETTLKATFEQVAKTAEQVEFVKGKLSNLEQEFGYHKRLMRRIEGHLDVLVDAYGNVKDKLLDFEDHMSDLEKLVRQ